MKEKILAMLVAFGLVGSVSAIEVNDKLSINGFIDSSWSSTDSGAANDDVNLGVDEIELNFLFNAGGVSGEVHVDNDGTPAPGSDNINIEQAHLSYGFEGGILLTLGRFNTALGLETEDPGGVYGTQRLYQNNANNLGDIDSNGGQEGLSVGYSAEQFSASITAFNAVGVDEEDAAGEDDLDFELALAFTGLENMTLGGGFQSLNGSTVGPVADRDVTSLNATYTAGQLLIGAEWVSIDTEGGTDESAWGVVADYDISDVLGVSVRYSDEDNADGAGNEGDRLSIAPNYSITDSLGAILEYTTANVGDDDWDSISLELTFTF
jgi:hypothetical protein